jgi:hypothetical protein
VRARVEMNLDQASEYLLARPSGSPSEQSIVDLWRVLVLVPFFLDSPAQDAASPAGNPVTPAVMRYRALC